MGTLAWFFVAMFSSTLNEDRYVHIAGYGGIATMLTATLMVAAVLINRNLETWQYAMALIS